MRVECRSILGFPENEEKGQGKPRFDERTELHIGSGRRSDAHGREGGRCCSFLAIYGQEVIQILKQSDIGRVDRGFNKKKRKGKEGELLVKNQPGRGGGGVAYSSRGRTQFNTPRRRLRGSWVQKNLGEGAGAGSQNN